MGAHEQGLLAGAVAVLSLLLLGCLVVLGIVAGRWASRRAAPRRPLPPAGSPGPADSPRGEGNGICVFDLDGTLLGAPGAKKGDRMGAVCKDAGFDLGVVTAGGTGPQRARDAAAVLGVAPATFKFFTSTHSHQKGEVIAGQLAKCYPPGRAPPRVILFDDNPDFSKSARDWGFCSSDAQSAAIRANHGVDARIVREGIAACAPWIPPMKAAPSGTQTGGACLREI